MKEERCSRFFIAAAAFFFAASFLISASALAQKYPDRPITIYCGYAAGATTDLTARALADGAEKLLGTSVVVESKPGGGATVAAGLVASKKPDGYTLGVISTAALTMRPHVLKLSYDPLKDFTVITQYSRYIGGLCVLSDSPIKTIDEFIAYAKANPGLSYGSSGMFTQQQLAVEALAQCKGLKFKHVPTKGGAEANTALLGKHTDFVAGAGQHIAYLKQGVFRMLVVYNAEKRDPKYPDIPILKDLGCEDVPANGYIVVAPKNLPQPISAKLGEVFKKVVESAPFQKVLENYDLPFDYKDQKQLAKDIPAEFEWYKTYVVRTGMKKEG
ncbi:MAG TPA: tripartite tricarboxylate transporter substrate binding protein [Thermodesulfobacteriota bacterium]|nr:tripartite tricarboxylate transporter substrate binding protein [Thermodesulfobacteriota bacterium]